MGICYCLDTDRDSETEIETELGKEIWLGENLAAGTDDIDDLCASRGLPPLSGFVAEGESWFSPGESIAYFTRLREALLEEEDEFEFPDPFVVEIDDLVELLKELEKRDLRWALGVC